MNSIKCRMEKLSQRAVKLDKYKKTRKESFEWTPETRHTFEDNVAEVIAFAGRHGELPKQRGHRDGGDEERLAWFLDHKRQVKKKNKLSAKHIQLMETIPDFDWVEIERFPFHVNVAKLQDFVSRHGEMPRPKGTRDNGEENTLAKFIGARRWAKKKGRLTAERIAILESIPGFRWRSFEKQRFENKVADVRHFLATHGEMPKLLGTRAVGEERKLASFVHSQRGNFKLAKLSKDRIDSLETIPEFSWERDKRPRSDSSTSDRSSSISSSSRKRKWSRGESIICDGVDDVDSGSDNDSVHVCHEEDCADAVSDGDVGVEGFCIGKCEYHDEEDGNSSGSEILMPQHYYDHINKHQSSCSPD